MGTLGRWTAIAALVLGASALAEPNDLRLWRLGNPSTQPEANDRFRVFARQLGAALSSVNLMPPETLGHAAFSVTAELSVVDLKTEEFRFPTEGDFKGPLLIPSVHLRKGMPFSFELGGRVAWIEKSRSAAATGELKWALNEGFALLPDLGVRGHLTRLINARDLGLTTGGVDVGLGKQLGVGGMLTLTPYVGWNLVWVFASSNHVDFKPEQTIEEATKTPTAQLEHADLFKTVTASHNRFYGGIRLIGGAVQFGAELSYSNLGRYRDHTGADQAMPAVTTYNLTFGLDF
jgi:hypothetical protein